MLLISKTDKSFFCSDNPIDIKWYDDPLGGNKFLLSPIGTGQKSIDIGTQLEFKILLLPINSKTCLLLFNKKLEELSYLNQGIGLIGDWNADIIDNINLSIRCNSLRKIYSQSNNFDNVLDMYSNKIDPRIRFRF